ncbi:MAG: NAD(P)-binding domain-containing protein [Legionella sp.]|nr:NAD(P)-binding domain-containing protein [Legionella sp.]
MRHIFNSAPRIGVIGAGPCGITAAKNLIQQGQTNFVVFEKNDCLGGNWVYDEENNHSSVYETTHIISSKRLSEFEDFPMPRHYPDYPSHRQLLSYFNSYAERFGVDKYIRFNTSVEQITQTPSKQWLIAYQDETGTHEDLFDYLLVANGHHWDPLMPTYPGKFNGEILHSHQYKKAESFKNKRVLVVGGGNSACDVAVEVARVASKTCISIRKGQHVFPKFIFGKPTDIAFAKINWMPAWGKQLLTTAVIRILQGRYAKYHLKKPVGKPLEVHPTINSELLYSIRHGKILPKEGIDQFDGESVCFVDGHREAFDTIIFATGYRTSFPFFNKELIDFSTLTQIPLYRKMMHPRFDNLYFIGLFQPQGCIWPLADYQAKIAACIIAGSLKRPTDLPRKIKQEMKKTSHHFRENTRHALEVNYQTFRRQLLRELKKEKYEKKLFLDNLRASIKSN